MPLPLWFILMPSLFVYVRNAVGHQVSRLGGANQGEDETLDLVWVYDLH